jgi:N-acetylmuramoyl-L-alanine amidase
MQSMLSRLGFDCGRVDGIYGPLAVRAVSEFQQNCGLLPDGVCTREVVAALHRVSTHTGEGPGIAVLRETESLTQHRGNEQRRVVIGSYAGMAAITQQVLRRCREDYELVTLVESDATTQAQSANRFSADVYLGFEAATDDACVVQYYEVPNFVSVGGRSLANAVCAHLRERIPEISVHSEGIRHSALRETRMPAVLCSLAPMSIISLKTSAIALAVQAALTQWWDGSVATNN